MITMLLSISMAFSLFAPMASAETESLEKVESQNQDQHHMIEIGKDQFSKQVINAVPVMSNYITTVENNLIINPAAESIVGTDIYEHYKRGVNRFNEMIRRGSLTIENGPNKEVIEPKRFRRSFSNSYWWGIAITFDNSETRSMSEALFKSATIDAFSVAVLAFVPGAQAAAVGKAIQTLSKTAIADLLRTRNQGYGVTINLHWAPVYFEITSN